MAATLIMFGIGIRARPTFRDGRRTARPVRRHAPDRWPSRSSGSNSPRARPKAISTASGTISSWFSGIDCLVDRAERVQRRTHVPRTSTLVIVVTAKPTDDYGTDSDTVFALISEVILNTFHR